MNDAYHIQKYIPNSLAIGDLGVNEMVYIADSLEEFFVNEVGVDVFNTVW